MSERARVAIHGFGRTGRQAFKVIWQGYRDCLNVAAVGIRHLDEAPATAHLLKYDSNYGRFGPEVTVEDSSLRVEDTVIPLVAAREPAELPWSDLGVDIVIEATGAYEEGRSAAGHLEAGAGKVILTAPSDDVDFTLVFGVNEGLYDPESHHLVSTGSDTMNALAVVVAVLEDAFEVRHALMTAVRAYTTAQKLLDKADTEDVRVSRAAPLSIVPTATRAAEDVVKVLPALAGRLDGFAVRVPVPTVSILELTAELGEPASVDEVNGAFLKAAEGALGRVLAVSDEPLVSRDLSASPFSAVIDAPFTMANGPLIKVSAWYDNEWGYSSRVVDAAVLVAGLAEACLAEG
jgi:glyceraldehyde 3-phosphate dehydrogenase